ncbi:MAG TPA: NCS2 family permease [Candidatus Thalassarchaeaceae archaeon]|nr:MAG TPA: NCS2 family permease [Candidatus Poseidoniales archaeon]HII89732.1 NCS2 family permease [Candidatus Thalassarchaeaceae archaeon]|tara:strand:- start:351 stop:1943 length:1593 start_codon:yes stop_codon:yes gene_type:complete
MSAVDNILDRTFGLSAKGVTASSEIRAGITTFLTMAYILFVNPSMLALTGIPFEDALFATAIAAFVGCIVMGLWANLPFALAPGMGLNAYFTFAVVGTVWDEGDGMLGEKVVNVVLPDGNGGTFEAVWHMGAWEVALLAVFLEGLLFLVLSLPQVGARTAMINAIPKDLKIATGAGIGSFLAIIGLREIGVVYPDAATLVNIGPHETWGLDHGALIGLLGLVLITVLMARGIKGAMIWGIMGASVWGWIFEAYDPYNDPTGYGGAGWNCPPGAQGVDPTAPNYSDCMYSSAPDPGSIVSMPTLPEETLFAVFSSETLSAVSDNMDIFLLVLIAFFFVDVFDTAGTLYSVGRQAGYVDADDQLMNSDEAFMSDAAATIVGALAGTSTTTTYIESGAGVEEGGKTGLVAVTVGILMLSGLFLSDLFQAIPTYAGACALVIIGALMMKSVVDINWNDNEMVLPAFLTIVLMPFTYSIADGIAWGVITYVAIKVGTQKTDELNPVMWTIAILMTMFYLGPGNETTFEWLFGLVF